MERALPILLFAVFAAAVPLGMIIAGRLLGPRRQGRVKEMPYESGMDPIHDTRRRFDVRFYLVAVAFLIFDVELLFLYPWAVASRNKEGLNNVMVSDSRLVFVEMMVFIVLLALGFIYVWRKGVFRWR